jgi:hypothetical protein
MTSRPLTSHPRTSHAQARRSQTSHPQSSHRPTYIPLRTILATLLATVLALGSVAYTAGTASARTLYDGPWSVLIVTASGSCDSSYRYGVRISDGNVAYEGIAPISLQGKVTPKGAVRVIVQAGSQWADGVGKLTRNRGGGIWKGQGMGGICAGTWQAERREN